MDATDEPLGDGHWRSDGLRRQPERPEVPARQRATQIWPRGGDGQPDEPDARPLQPRQVHVAAAARHERIAEQDAADGQVNDRRVRQELAGALRSG